MNSLTHNTATRPKPLTVNGLSYGVVRGPNAAGEWYWRARSAVSYTHLTLPTSDLV